METSVSSMSNYDERLQAPIEHQTKVVVFFSSIPSHWHFEFQLFKDTRSFHSFCRNKCDITLGCDINLSQ